MITSKTIPGARSAGVMEWNWSVLGSKADDWAAEMANALADAPGACN
ncbi:hypothetical protein [Breoghania sp. L-A4]|nr:hypothetical protein [Breoghania sp. L-A4]